MRWNCPLSKLNWVIILFWTWCGIKFFTDCSMKIESFSQLPSFFVFIYCCALGITRPLLCATYFTQSLSFVKYILRILWNLVTVVLRNLVNVDQLSLEVLCSRTMFYFFCIDHYFSLTRHWAYDNMKRWNNHFILIIFYYNLEYKYLCITISRVLS